MYKAIANVVFVLLLIFHIFFIHVLMVVVLPPGTNVLWAIPFALVYAIFMAITIGICYYYVLPEKSKEYWHD